jgi:hypothetical protein
MASYSKHLSYTGEIQPQGCTGEPHLVLPDIQQGWRRWISGRPFLCMLALPILLTFSVLVVTITVLLSTAVMLSGDYVNPLTVFDALMPGQPKEGLAQYPHVCPYAVVSQYQYNDDALSCEIHLDEGRIHWAVVHVRQEIIYLYLSDIDDLQVVDLVQHWGEPDNVQKSTEGYAVQWHQGIYATVSTPRRFTYQAPVQSIAVFLKNSE